MKQYLRLVRLSAARRHRALIKLSARALRDEHGGEVLEYAVVASLIVLGAISTISCVGTKVLARWNSINSSI